MTVERILAKVYQQTMLGTKSEHEDYEAELKRLQQRYEILVEIRNVRVKHEG